MTHALHHRDTPSAVIDTVIANKTIDNKAVMLFEEE
jgi:hypothetical protein